MPHPTHPVLILGGVGGFLTPPHNCYTMRIPKHMKPLHNAERARKRQVGKRPPKKVGTSVRRGCHNQSRM